MLIVTHSFRLLRQEITVLFTYWFKGEFLTIPCAGLIRPLKWELGVIHGYVYTTQEGMNKNSFKAAVIVRHTVAPCINLSVLVLYWKRLDSVFHLHSTCCASPSVLPQRVKCVVSFNFLKRVAGTKSRLNLFRFFFFPQKHEQTWEKHLKFKVTEVKCFIL